ncbi:MAG: cyclodeaminase/cyclohydrolase family protein [Lachnospiraceae bacterium]|nr:cyclodeaminase/cyclohydrolase family protein [Lachnospiraceae bacterium]
MKINEFMNELSSKNPVPGGGGASALIGAISAALCGMVSNLTSGKKKYAQYQKDIELFIERAERSQKNLLSMIQKDAEAFEPLALAYGIPKDQADRDEILERALTTACTVPMEILTESAALISMIEELAVKGSKLAISDVGVAAVACRAAMEGSIMNVYINTKLMKNRDYALKLNEQAEGILREGIKLCDEVYLQISEELKS